MTFSHSKTLTWNDIKQNILNGNYSENRIPAMLIRQGVLYTFDQKEKEQKEQWQAAISNKWPFMASASKV